MTIYKISHVFDNFNVIMSKRMDKTIFSDWLLQQLQDKGWSQAELARASGLTRQAISNYINGVVRKPDEDALASIARGLRLPVQTVYQAAGILPPKPEMDEQTERLLHLYNQMTDDEREEWVALGEFVFGRRKARKASRAEV